MTDTVTPDFVAHFGPMSSVWSITAETDSAKEFANEHLYVEDWQGTPENFMTDWRPARDLCFALRDQGFLVACLNPSRPGYGFLPENDDHG